MQLIGQLTAVEAGHYDVSQQQIDPERIPLLVGRSVRCPLPQIQFWKIIRRLNVAIEVPMNAADIGNIAAKPAKPTAT
jgi:hypothetical protein